MQPTCCPPLTTALLIIISVVNFFRCTEAAQNVLQPTEVISLKSGGKVRGFVQSVVDLGHRGQQKQQKVLVNVSTFIGIQYATARRFEKPKSAVKLSEKADTVQEVTRYRFACPQEHLSQLGSEEQLSSQPPEANQTRYASEDCLYLNIWSPRRGGGGNESSAEEGGPLPVMVWLHDGTESARDHLLSRSTIFSKAFDGRRLAATGNVVVISAAYRVGVFGYLYLEGGGDGKEDQANFALYDQLAALKWVKENVHLFSGDPKRVTLFGDSGGGAASVGILILSPKTDDDDLFQRAILQSGSPLAVVDDHHSAAAKTRLLSSMVGCSKNSSSKSKLIKCLQSKPTLELLNASLAMAEVGLHFRPVFGEGKAGEDSSLLPRSPLDLLLSKKKKISKKVDLLFGITANEGSPAVYDLYPQLDVNESLSVEEAEQLLSNLMHLLRVPFLEEVLDFYLDDLNANSQHQANESELRRAIENAYGDLTTVVPTILFAQLLYRHYQRIDKNSSGRFYAYHLGQPLPPTSSSSGCLPWMGVCSGSTVEYIFGTFFGGGDDEHGDDNGTGNELGAYSQLSRAMMTAWASFAESGQPKLLPKDLKAAGAADIKDEEIKWAEAFNSSSKVGGGDNSNQQSLINFMNLKVGDLQQAQEDLLLNNEQNCSEIAFWAEKLVTMYSSNSGAEDDDD